MLRIFFFRLRQGVLSHALFRIVSVTLDCIQDCWNCIAWVWDWAWEKQSVGLHSMFPLCQRLVISGSRCICR